MQNILILYSTVDGQTLKICKKISDDLKVKDHSVELSEIDDFNKSLTFYDTIIIGASIRYGEHREHVTQFIKTYKTDLDKIKTAFFSVNLVARKSNKNAHNSNPYVIKFFKQIDWKPNIIEVFAGLLDYSAYPWFDRLMIRFIMRLTKGPTKSDKPIEFTNWRRVNNFIEKVSNL